MPDVLWWVALTALLGLSFTQWVGFDSSKAVAVAQSLSPHALATALPLGVMAALAGRPVVAALMLLPLATLLWLAVPVVRAGRGAVAPHASGDALSLAFGNMLAENRRVAHAVAALAGAGADVMVMVEFTPDMERALEEQVGDGYPHRVGEVRPDPAGIAVWSRVPLEGEVVHIVGRPSVDVTVHLGGGPLRLLAVHTTPPTMRARVWRDELRAIGDAAHGSRPGPPTVLLGDFNAARWHPTFRALLARGWRLAHEVVGHGWTASWPTRGYPAPPFVRIDHVLLDTRVQPTSVTELDIPGSDHRGFVMGLGVSSAPAAR